MEVGKNFLPLCRTEADSLGIGTPDFVYVCGDAYVDHPSFGVAIISRVLEAAGYTVCILAQPDYRSADAFREYGKPRLGFLVSAGNIDSMVAHYSVTKHRRGYDYYSPGGKAGLRPDRATIVYCNRIREAYGDVPIIIGGLEASLRRFAHYDYWDDKVRRSILVDSRADILSYGMGEKSITEIAALLARGVPVKKIHGVRGTVYLAKTGERPEFPYVCTGDYDTLKTDKKAYADAFAEQYRNMDAITGKAVTESYGDRILVQNPPMPPLEREELDRVYALPYMRTYHPSYKDAGGVPAIEEVRFSITHNRGCFGSCNFCALTFHQGRSVRSRSEQSVIDEAKLITSLPDFKGYIHDVGGPTANFRLPACEKQLTSGVCRDRRCLAPVPCRNLRVDHSEYLELLRKLRALPKVKKVFIRSGIRFDYLVYDNDDTFFRELVENHISGQLKVAPEHCSANVLNCMGKPDFSVYRRFADKFYKLSQNAKLEQYLVPYLISSHPGSTVNDAVELALMLKRERIAPEQVQDFYPTPGTVSTVMYYTGTDPLTGKPVYVAKTFEEKKMQRALLQYYKRENSELVRRAFDMCGRPGELHLLYDSAPDSTGAAKEKQSAEKIPDRVKSGKYGKSDTRRPKAAGRDTFKSSSRTPSGSGRRGEYKPALGASGVKPRKAGKRKNSK